MAIRPIKSQLVLDGEKEYRQGLDAAYKAVNKLGNELKTSEAAFLDNSNSMEANRAKAEVLRKEIDAQKDVIRSLMGRMKEIKGAYGDNTEAQDHYSDKVAVAMRTLQRMERDLAKAESGMKQMGDSSEQAAGDLKKTEDAARNTGHGLEKLSGGFTVLKGAMSNILGNAMRLGARALKDTAVDSIELASDLQEVDNVVTTAFGHATGEVKAFADGAITQFGLSSLAAQNYAGKLGAAFNALGLQSRAQEMSTTLTGLSGDLASFWNITSDEAYTKVFAGVISGETEGLKSLGIVMTDTNLTAFALTEGIKKKLSAMTAAEKAELRYRYVLNATSQAQGDFAKTSGSYANQMRVATLQIDNAKTAIGNGLLPAVTSVISRFNEWMSKDYAKALFAEAAEKAGEFATGALTMINDALVWIVENTDILKKSLVSIGVGILGAKVLAFVGTMVKLVAGIRNASGAMATFNTVMAANPIWLVAIGVAALTATMIALADSYANLDSKLSNLKLAVPQASVDAVATGINDGIAAANKVHEVTVTINADTQSLKDQLAEAFSEDSPNGEALSN